MRRDDGAGIAAVQAWQAAYPATAALPGVRVEIAGLAGMELITLLQGARAAVLVDAVQTQAAPGRLFCLQEADLAGFTAASGSAHGWGITETLALGRQLGLVDLPDGLILVAIAGGDFGAGPGLTPAVQAAIPGAANLIEDCARQILPAENQN